MRTFKAELDSVECSCLMFVFVHTQFEKRHIQCHFCFLGKHLNNPSYKFRNIFFTNNDLMIIMLIFQNEDISKQDISQNLNFVTRIPTVKLKIPGKAFLNPNPELLLHSSYSF